MLTIRIARLEDAAELAHIQVDSYCSAYAGILPQDFLDHFTYAEQEQDWRDLLAETGHQSQAARGAALLLVAETEGGLLVGYALGRPESSALPPFDCELAALHVRRAFQWQGTGRALMVEMARRLEAAGCASLGLTVLEQNPAVAFYERLGGRLAGRLERQLGDDHAPFISIERIYAWDDIRQLSAQAGIS